MELVSVTGINEVLGNMKNAPNLYGRSIARGLKQGGKFLLRESKKIVPVDTGNLKASGFVRSEGSGIHTDVTVGYTANYAVYVHEDMEKAHGADYNIKHLLLHKRGKKKGQIVVQRGENQQAKFLERPALEQRDQILGIIFQEAKNV